MQYGYCEPMQSARATRSAPNFHITHASGAYGMGGSPCALCGTRPRLFIYLLGARKPRRQIGIVNFCVSHDPRIKAANTWRSTRVLPFWYHAFLIKQREDCSLF